MKMEATDSFKTLVSYIPYYMATNSRRLILILTAMKTLNLTKMNTVLCPTAMLYLYDAKVAFLRDFKVMYVISH
jgi:hypothetical protein